MQSRLIPYLTFQGNAREVMEFYKTVFGGTLEATTFKEGGMPADPAFDDQLMHAKLTADNDIVVMASDAGDMGGKSYQKGTNISMSLGGDNEEELTGYFNKLAEGGEIAQPLTKASWGDTFGMFTDKYGIFWLVNIAGKTA